MQYVMLGEVIQSAKSDRCGNDDYPVLSITKGEGIILQSNKFKKRIASQDTSQYKVVCRGQLVQGIHIDEANFGIQDIVDGSDSQDDKGLHSPVTGTVHQRICIIILLFPQDCLKGDESSAFLKQACHSAAVKSV